MLNRAVHGYLPAFQDHLRPSVLGRAVGRKMRTLTNPPPHGDGEDDDEAPRSPATDAHMRAFFDAWSEGDEEGQKSALGNVVESWRADNAAGGVPVYGHLTLPRDFADQLKRLASDSSDKEARWSPATILHGLSEGVQTAVARQLAVGQPTSRLVTDFTVVDGSSPGGTAALMDRGSPRFGTAFRDEQGALRIAAGSNVVTLSPTGNGAIELVAKKKTAAERARELNERDPVAAVAHPFAYGLDRALNDLIGKDGAFGDWGKREVIPEPTNELARRAGELIRHYLQIAAPLGTAKHTAVIRAALEKRGARAVIGGALSIAAEYSANGEKATGWDYALAFASGAASGGIEPETKAGKAGFDASLAFSSSVLGDILSGRDVDIGLALLAGTSAGLITFLGGLANLDKARLFSQFGAKYAKKYLEKAAKEFFKAWLGDELVLGRAEWDRFMDALTEEVRRQYEQFIQTGDTNPVY